MALKIMFFGQLKDIAGCDQMAWDNKVNTVDALKNQLENAYPSLANVTYRFAVNAQMVDGHQELQGDETIALMPPFSGG